MLRDPLRTKYPANFMKHGTALVAADADEAGGHPGVEVVEVGALEDDRIDLHQAARQQRTKDWNAC